jgi:hypothetical protein
MRKIGSDDRARALRPAAKLTLITMWTFTTKDGPWYCTKSAKDLAEASGMAESTIEEAWPSLRAAGLIKWEGNGYAGGRNKRRDLQPIVGTTEWKLSQPVPNGKVPRTSG